MNWGALLAAVSMVESGGNHAAINPKEGAYGELQIRQRVLDDVNRHYGTNITMDDVRRSRTVSRIVFVNYVTMWGARNEEEAARIWNGGPRGMEKEATRVYWGKVKRELDRITGGQQKKESAPLTEFPEFRWPTSGGEE